VSENHRVAVVAEVLKHGSCFVARWTRIAATGADPPFADPARAHGTAMEGYYWRVVDAEAGSVIVVLCGSARGREDRGLRWLWRPTLAASRVTR
jgi:hypothetical protein